MFRIIICITIILSFLSCTVPQGNYVDTLTMYNIKQNISSDESDDVVKLGQTHKKIGLVYTKKTCETIKIVESFSDALPRMAKTCKADLNIDFLLKNIEIELKRNFDNVIIVDSASNKSPKVDLYAYLDLKIKFGKISGDFCTINCSIYFVNNENICINGIYSEEKGVIPYPASTAGFTSAAREIVEDLKFYFDPSIRSPQDRLQLVQDKMQQNITQSQQQSEETKDNYHNEVINSLQDVTNSIDAINSNNKSGISNQTTPATSSSSNSSSHGHMEQVKCSACNGTGNNPSWQTGTCFGVESYHWCDVCKKDVPCSHGAHGSCLVCKGNGYVKRYVH